MTIPAVPKNPKAEDLDPVLVALDERIAALEAVVFPTPPQPPEKTPNRKRR